MHADRVHALTNFNESGYFPDNRFTFFLVGDCCNAHCRICYYALDYTFAVYTTLLIVILLFMFASPITIMLRIIFGICSNISLSFVVLHFTR